MRAVSDSVHKSQLTSLFWPVKNVLRRKWSDLLVFLFSSEQNASERKYIAQQFSGLIKGLEAMLSEQTSNLLEAFCDDLFNQCIIESEDFKRIRDALNNIKKRRVWCKEVREKEVAAWHERIERGKESYLKTNTLKSNAILVRMEPLYEKVTTDANEVTKLVMEEQNRARTQYLASLKEISKEQYSTRKSWNAIIETFSHERAIWFDADSFPQSWQLDPTEGPSRIRRRLKRAHLTIPERFFLDEAKHKSRMPPPRPPLQYLFESKRLEMDSSAFKNEIIINESISLITPGTWVTPQEEFFGEILVGNISIHFVGHTAKSTTSQITTVVKERIALYAEIKEVEKRRYQLKNNAVEIFLTNGSSYLIAFGSENERHEFFEKLSQYDMPNKQETVTLAQATQLWRDRIITNFDYLMFLNKAAGRSFNDLMQYPVFPFVIADYINEMLDFRDSKTFRKLSKPLPVQEKGRESFYVQQFQYLKNECQRQQQHQFMPVMAPFHYGAVIVVLMMFLTSVFFRLGSHYSNSGTVLHFLVRLPPFTQIFIQYQDKNFDIPDRTFHSIATTYKVMRCSSFLILIDSFLVQLASGGSTTDFKELIPEFFYLPEFLQVSSSEMRCTRTTPVTLCSYLKNFERFNFGNRQHNGLPVDDVLLPLWCRRNPRLFVFINRQALESSYVTERLNNWIDLVFGYKQSGRAAEEAVNVYHPATYYGVDVDKIEDPLRRSALEAMIKTFGQMPRQLFNRAHPTASLKYDTSTENPVCGEVRGKHGHIKLLFAFNTTLLQDSDGARTSARRSSRSRPFCSAARPTRRSTR